MSSRPSNSVIVAIEYYYVDVHSIYSEHQRRHIKINSHSFNVFVINIKSGIPFSAMALI